MTRAMNGILACAVMLTMFASVWAQESEAPADSPEQPAVEKAKDELEDLSQRVDQSEQAERVRAGILKPIYTLAEQFSFSAFHWVAFAIMVTGVVSFVLQLTLGKLVVLSRASISPAEILSDILGLAVSLIGLVLTTQAAAENSNFTASAFSVISSTCVGAVVGFVFYIWGQRQELQAVAGRKVAAVADRTATKTK